MEVVFRSDTGKKRKNNQDFAGYFINKNNIMLAILCDGMGGHRGGDVASEMAVSQLGHSWEESTVQNAEQVNFASQQINVSTSETPCNLST